MNVEYRNLNQVSKKTPLKKIQERIIASRLVPATFNSTIMCIGSELGGIGACSGDEGGPGFLFDIGDYLMGEKYVQVGIKTLSKNQYN